MTLLIQRQDVTTSDGTTPEGGIYITVKYNGILASIVDANGNAAANPLQSGTDGSFSYYVAQAGTYTEEYRFNLTDVPKTTLAVYIGFDSDAASTRATNEAIAAANAQAGAQAAEAGTLSAISGASGSLGTVILQAATRTILAGLSTSLGLSAMLLEPGREGIFKWTASNLSSMVSADTAQAIYVAPNSDTTGASGAWVRVRESNHLHIDWFGAVGDGLSDDTTAFTAMRSLAAALGTSPGSGINTGPSLYLGPKTYKLASSFSWKGCTNNWYGCGSGTLGSNSGLTNILMASGCTFTNEAANTENGTTGTTISTFGATSTRYHDICFMGPGKGVGTAPVFKMRGVCNFRDCRFVAGGSHGLDIEATAGGGTNLEGNDNSWSMTGGGCIGNGGNGLCIGGTAGSDTNAGYTSCVYFAGNTLEGVLDQSLLGNQIHGHWAANGNGAPFRTTNANAATVFSGYIESGQGKGVLTGHSYWAGGIMGDGITGAYITSANGQFEFSAAACLGDFETTGNLRIDAGNVVYNAGVQVLASRYSGTPGAATDLTSALTLVNFLRDALLNHHGAIG